MDIIVAKRIFAHFQLFNYQFGHLSTKRQMLDRRWPISQMSQFCLVSHLNFACSVPEKLRLVSVQSAVKSWAVQSTVSSTHPMLFEAGAVATLLVRSYPDQGVWVRALAWDIMLCSQARHFTLTVPLSTQVYKWVPANLMLGVTLQWTSTGSQPWGSKNTPCRFSLQNLG